jgi:hypothetical protein
MAAGRVIILRVNSAGPHDTLAPKSIMPILRRRLADGPQDVACHEPLAVGVLAHRLQDASLDELRHIQASRAVRHVEPLLRNGDGQNRGIEQGIGQLQRKRRGAPLSQGVAPRLLQVLQVPGPHNRVPRLLRHAAQEEQRPLTPRAALAHGQEVPIVLRTVLLEVGTPAARAAGAARGSRPSASSRADRSRWGCGGTRRASSPGRARRS